MVQWMTLFRNSGFVNLLIIRIMIVRKTGAVGLVLPGLTAGRQAGRKVGR